MAKDTGLGEGVYFAQDAYSGLGRRFFIQAIDLAVLLVGSYALGTGFFVVTYGDPVYFLWLLFGTWWGYLVLVESIVGTLGFWIAGVRIVDCRGQRPSILRMSGRFLLLLLGPFNPILDLFWLASDAHRQTLRDKFAGTFVVKKDAQPVGKGQIRVRVYLIMGMTIAFAEIQHTDTATL